MVNEKEQLEKIAIMLKYKKRLKKNILKLADVDEQFDSFKAAYSIKDVMKGRIAAEKHLKLCAETANEIYAPGDDESELAEWISYNVKKIKAVVDRM